MNDVKKSLNKGLFYLLVGVLLSAGSMGIGYIIVFTDTIIPENLKFVIIVLQLILTGGLVVVLAQNLSKIKKTSAQLVT